MRNREVFLKLKGKLVKLELKPNNFGLTGVIDEVFEDCIAFRTKQKTSYIDFTRIETLIPME